MITRKRLKIKSNIIYSILIILGVLSISLGYSSLHSFMGISSPIAFVRINRDIRITKVNVDSTTNDAVSMYEEYDKDKLSFNVNLPNSDSSVTYRVKVTNFGNVVEGILNINGLPDELTYTLNGYDLRTKICNSANSCINGIEKEFLITIKYKDGTFNSSKIDYPINLDVVFSPFYRVTYNANGGSVNPSFKDVMYKDVYGTLPQPSKTGHTFNGWKLNSSNITNTSIVNTASNHTLVADYTTNKYDVGVNGSNVSISSTSFQVDYSGYKEITVTPSNNFYLSNVTCTNGYTATGFSTGKNATGTQTIRINNNSNTNSSTCTVSTTSVGPICTFGNIDYVSTNDTKNITMTCNSYSGFKSTSISTSDFTSSNVDIGKVTNVSLASSSTNQAVYNVTLRGVAAGTFNLSLNAGALADLNNNTNKKADKTGIVVVGFEVNSTNVSLNLGTTKNFQINVIGGNYGNVTYSSSNSSIATVSSTGLITSKASGTATITVTEGRYNLSRKINVSVSDNLVINYELAYLKSSNNQTSITYNSSYSTMLSPTNKLLYGRPSSIKIYVNGSQITSGYSYNSVDGSLSISNVTGDLKIVATAAVLSDENISFEKPYPIASNGIISSVSMTQAHQLRIFKFIPTETRSYTFQSFDSDADNNDVDPYAYLFDGSVHTVAELDAAAEIYADDGTYDELENLCMDYDDDGGEGYNFQITQTLTAGKTYYLALRAYSTTEIETYVDIRVS